MIRRITATELARSLSDVLNRVKYRHEAFVIERSGEAVAELHAPGPAEGPTLRELAARLDGLWPDGGFAADLARIRAAQGEPRNPWPS
jgi:antitoxin (DNA-binding transcriptional repressor) of toxin-antitoxin stability system